MNKKEKHPYEQKTDLIHKARHWLYEHQSPVDYHSVSEWLDEFEKYMYKEEV